MKFAEEQPTRQQSSFRSYIFKKLLEAAICSWKHGFAILAQVLIHYTQHCKWKPFHFKSSCQFVSICAFIPVRHSKAVNTIQLVIYSQCHIYIYNMVIGGPLQEWLGFSLLTIIAHNLPSLHSRSGMLQGVTSRLVLQLTNRIIAHMQKALKRFCHSFIFPLLINTMYGRSVWGNYNSVREVPLENLGSWASSTLFLTPEIQIFTKELFAQLWYPSVHFSFFGWGWRNLDVRSWREGQRQRQWRGLRWIKAHLPWALNLFV